MNTSLKNYITELLKEEYAPSEDRKVALNSLVEFIHQNQIEGKTTNLIFICTHNSRRSHLSQVWAQVAAQYFKLDKVYCYSGGTEATALFPMTAKTLDNAGLEVKIISQLIEGITNPIYTLKYDDSLPAMIGFSKTYDHLFNPQQGFAAVMTCSHADENCPFIPTAAKRISLPFEDPKVSDGTPEQEVVYASRSQQIAREMFYVFSQVGVTVG